MNEAINHDAEDRAIETAEWLDSMDEVLQRSGPDRVEQLLGELSLHAHHCGLRLRFSANTPYINTITPAEQPAYPGNRKLEARIESIIRWNAMAMVVRANREESGIGGHIATYASAATLYEVGFNHFFRGKTERHPGDLVYFQGHAAPGIYARAFLEGRLSTHHVDNFRHELRGNPGLPSYPHPWLMPDFWKFPTVSMGLAPIMAIYNARFIKYLEDRGLKERSDQRVWAFLGDGETDEPESLGAITLASRENLDNLIFVINCNLQRLDGPVRGNGKIIQELEATFRGAGWNVIKVIWGQEWDALLEKDTEGHLVKRMDEVVDGQYQKYSVSTGDYVRQHFFGKHPRLLQLVKHLSDEQIMKLSRGGHDAYKVYAAYRAAVEHTGSPTVILAKTIKGFGMGESGEGQNITHQQKKMNEESLRAFRTRFNIPLSDDDVASLPFYKPDPNSPEIKYLQARRSELGGHAPERRGLSGNVKLPDEALFREFYDGTGEREVSTTMAFVRILTKLLKDPDIGKLIVPIVPDEARTFGMEALFRQCGIYSHCGQLYEPVDKDNFLYYKEAQDGQILEEGITEAGSLSSFIAAGTAYSQHGINTIPFFTFYSMFGFQRVGDLIWAAADSRCKGFMMGGTSGRTTLAGEGLQHQDGHSHVLALSVPNLLAYDVTYAYELAVIIREGIRRMYVEGEDIFYYITIANENYAHYAIPEGVTEDILKGMYRFRSAAKKKAEHKVRLLGSGCILNEVIKAAGILDKDYGVASDIWAVTSYKELHREALDVERWNRLHPDKEPRVPHVAQCLAGTNGPVVAASDYMKSLPDLISHWIPGMLTTLGTDGFGRSDGRERLRAFFEVDAANIAYAALSALAREGRIDNKTIVKARKKLGINPKKPNPRDV